MFEQLPAGSRCVKEQDPGFEWETTDYLLWQIEYGLRSLIWMLSSTKKKKKPKPKPLPTPPEIVEANKKKDAALAARAEIDKKLGFEKCPM